MQTATDPIISRTTKHLLLTCTLSHDRGVHRTFSIKIPLDQIRDRDVDAVILALQDEAGRRFREHWEVPDTPLF